MIPSLQPPLTVRRALDSEACRIAELRADVFSASLAHSVEPQELAAFLALSSTTIGIIQDLNNDQKDVIVATDLSGHILGFAYLTRERHELCLANVERKIELQRIYVDHSAQGRGIGRLLATTAEDMARTQGFQNMWLGVWEKNEKATEAYKSWGYRVVGEHIFTVGSAVQKDYILLKSL